MKEKYGFLLSLKSLEYEIRELTIYSKEYVDCFELLKDRLDYLSQFILREENIQQWNLWGSHQEVREHSGRLRETSAEALCDMEKYQSLCTCKNELDISHYIESLANTVKQEIQHFLIDHQSKILFIGSGAFPTSALTIAKETSAEVMCLDIDIEALNLAEKVADVSNLGSIVKFSDQDIKELPFVKEATHIIIASLVKNKREVLDSLIGLINSNTKVILRYGNGLKSIFNYPMEEKLSADWVQTEIHQRKNIYDTLILEKSKSLVKTENEGVRRKEGMVR
ncbi:nicotianamine synthase family protein [Desmospora profundinema]|uniref:Nicotianamine synthase n=1 Tax=Desmospora profundinema TaxID=1571184 RepID=A0ABU1ILT5_9BACL|nr:nicotianamine synthase family protein [Desmospora profundinema]MDR6225698.1 hypothetical protein [Desmospora profundinema]